MGEIQCVYILEFQNPEKKLAFLSLEIAKEAARQEELTNGAPPMRIIQIPFADARYATKGQMIKIG